MRNFFLLITMIMIINSNGSGKEISEGWEDYKPSVDCNNLSQMKYKEKKEKDIFYSKCKKEIDEYINKWGITPDGSSQYGYKPMTRSEREEYKEKYGSYPID